MWPIPLPPPLSKHPQHHSNLTKEPDQIMESLSGLIAGIERANSQSPLTNPLMSTNNDGVKDLLSLRQAVQPAPSFYPPPFSHIRRNPASETSRGASLSDGATVGEHNENNQPYGFATPTTHYDNVYQNQNRISVVPHGQPAPRSIEFPTTHISRREIPSSHLHLQSPSPPKPSIATSPRSGSSFVPVPRSSKVVLKTPEGVHVDLSTIAKVPKSTNTPVPPSPGPRPGSWKDNPTDNTIQFETNELQRKRLSEDAEKEKKGKGKEEEDRRKETQTRTSRKKLELRRKDPTGPVEGTSTPIQRLKSIRIESEEQRRERLSNGVKNEQGKEKEAQGKEAGDHHGETETQNREQDLRKEPDNQINEAEAKENEEEPFRRPSESDIPFNPLLEDFRTVVGQLNEIIRNVQQYKQLLQCRESDAQQLLDTFQMILGMPELNLEFRRHLIVATQRLSRQAALYPTCYDLGNIELTSDHPVASGGFADIYKGRFLGQVVCLKVIRLYQTSHVDSFLKQFFAEAILWSQLFHVNLLPIYGLYRYNARLCLVSPWMEYGDINAFLNHQPDASRILLVSDVVSGLAYLHDHNIVHGDLKGANILVNDSRRACLADFGLAAVSDADILHWTSHSSAASKGGSVRWQAPELFDIENDQVVYNSKSSDVYALSCVTYEIFTGKLPFFELTRDSTIMYKVKAGAQPSRPPVSSLSWGTWGLTEWLWSLMETCWSVDPNTRPAAQAIIGLLSTKNLVDDRPVWNWDALSPLRFRSSMSSQSTSSSVDDIGELLSRLSHDDGSLDPISLSMDE